MNKHYYCVSFKYAGPKVGVLGDTPADRKASRACMRACDAAIELLSSIPGVRAKHAYGFPDGSCYQYVLTALGHDELSCEMAGRLKKPLLYVDVINKVSARSNPWKCYHKTLASYMRSKDGK